MHKITMLVGLVLALLASATWADGSVPEGFTFVAGGDMIGPYHAFPDDADFANLRALFQGADIGFANQEGSIFDLKSFSGFPAAENGGGYPLQPTSFARDLKGFGISLVSKANNHATDWGMEGLAATLRSLSAAGVAEAGAGEGLPAARAPAYVESRKGTVALIDAASTFPPMAVAGPTVTRDGVTSRARVGISPLHVREIGRVSADQLEALRKIAGSLNQGGSADEVRLSDQVFSSRPGPRWEMDPQDEVAILSSIREARSKAQFVIFSIHAHQTAGDEDSGPTRSEAAILHWANEAASPADPRPADFEPKLFHEAIDAGADVVVRTGPHVLGGIEIYKGKPIFYSLASLFLDFRGKRSFVDPLGITEYLLDADFDTVIPVTRYRNGKVDQIHLYPYVIQLAQPPAGGIPRTANSAEARRILDHLKAMSEAFGTHMKIVNNVGVISLAEQ